MSTPSASRIVAAPIANLQPGDLAVNGGSVVSLGFVALADGTAVVKWASPLDPDNPEETIDVKAGWQYPFQVEEIVSSDVDLLLYFGTADASGAHVGGSGAAGGGGGGAVTQDAGSGTAAGFWTVRLSDGTSFYAGATETTLTALNGKFATAVAIGTGGAALPTTQTFGAQLLGYYASPVAALPTTNQTYPLRMASRGGLIIEGTTANGASFNGNAVCVAGVEGGGTQRGLLVDSLGRQRVLPAGAAPIADATTDVYTKLPASGLSAFSSGGVTLKASAGRFRTIDVYYEGATVSGLWVQVHNASAVGSISANTLLLSQPINAGSNQVPIERLHDIPFSSGLTLVFATNRFDPGALNANVATTEAGRAAFWGA